MNDALKSSHGGWRPAPDRFIKIMDDPFYHTLVSLQDLLTVCTTDFWASRQVKALHVPITTSSVSSPMGLGSDSTPVAIDLFGDQTFLADSMQFMLEYGCRFNTKGAWYLMPSFRGEEADETHLNQFFHSEAEIAGGLEDVMTIVQEYVRTLAQSILDNLADEVASFTHDVGHVEEMAGLDSFPRLTLDEAIEHLGADPLSVHHAKGWRSLTRHGERRLLNEISPVLWVTHFDHLGVPFYQGYADAEQRSSLSADLLFGIGEVVGSGERHATGADTRKALSHHEVSEDAYRWYVDMKDARPLRTSGFGMGVERWLMWVLKQNDIRELQLTPRLNGVALTP